MYSAVKSARLKSLSLSLIYMHMKITEQCNFISQVHSSPGNEGIIYALSWAPGIFVLLFIIVGILIKFQILNLLICK